MPGAARKGDMTAHGGMIAGGLDTVLIEGMAAARNGDMHVCPLCNPGTPPPPHVGGPIAGGSATVLIGGMPAARVGDIVTCIGPPDCIVAGSGTVMIGDAGGSDSNGGGGAAKQASAAAHQALESSLGVKKTGPHWIEFEFVDESDKPLTGLKYHYTDVDSEVSEHVLTADGRIIRGGLPEEGDCEVAIRKIEDAKWSVSEATVGEIVSLSAKCHGFTDGTPVSIDVWQRNRSGGEKWYARVETEIQSATIQVDWTLEKSVSTIDNQDVELKEPQWDRYYFFRVKSGACESQSPLLKVLDWLEIVLENVENEVGKNYMLVFADGSVKSGTIDSSGIIREDSVPPGGYELIIVDGDEIQVS